MKLTDYLTNNSKMPAFAQGEKNARNNVSNAIKPTVPTQIDQAQGAGEVSSTASTQNIASNETVTNALKAQSFVQAPISYNFVREIKLPFSNSAKLFKLANGQKIAVLEKKGPTVLQTYFNVGSMNEPDNVRGISHFNEHMAFNGSKSPVGKSLSAGEFFKTVNEMGAMTNASTGFSLTDYFVSSQLLGKNIFDKTVYIQSQQLQYPEHAENMVEKEKGPVTSEISMVGDEPSNKAINNCIKNLYNIETTSPDLVAGTVKNINNLTNKDTLDYYNLWYTPDNCSTVVTGEIPSDEAMTTIAKHFNKTANVDTSKRKYQEFKGIDKPVRVDMKMPKAQSSSIVLGLVGPKNNSTEENIKMELLMTALLGYKNARLSKELDRIQSGAMMNIERTGNRPTDPKTILIASESTPEKTESVIKTIYDEVGKLTVKPLNAEELNTAKNILKMTYSRISENSQLLNMLIGNALMDDDLNYVENYLPILEKLTPEDISAFAQKYLDLNKASLSVVHPEGVDNNVIMANYKNANSNAPSKILAPTKSAQIAFKGRVDENISQKTFDTSKVKQFKLANNMEVVLNPNHSDLADASIVFSTHAPANVQPAVPSILSVILNEGTMNKKYDEFYTDIHKTGAGLTLDTNFSSIAVDVNCLSKDLGTMLDKAKEILGSPRITPATLEYAKKLVKESVLTMDNQAGEAAFKKLFPNSPEFATKEEMLKSIDNTTIQDVQGFFNYIKDYGMAKATITAPFEKEAQLEQTALQKLSNDFCNFKPFELNLFKCFNPVAKNEVVTKSEPRNQADITQTFKFKTGMNPKDYVSFALLNTILGDGPSSRLFDDLREKRKLAYRVESSLNFVGDTGLITLGIKTTTDDPSAGIKQYDNVDKSLDGFNEHINKMKTEKVTPQELEAAKLRMKTKLLNSIESSGSQTTVLRASKSSLLGINALNENLKLIDEITADDIYNAANYMFAGDSVASVLASEDTLNNIKAKPAA